MMPHLQHRRRQAIAPQSEQLRLRLFSASPVSSRLCFPSSIRITQESSLPGFLLVFGGHSTSNCNPCQRQRSPATQGKCPSPRIGLRIVAPGNARRTVGRPPV